MPDLIAEAVICTWNRAAQLDATLQRLTEIEVPQDTVFRIVVVDNNSTDPTPEVVAQYQDRLDLRLVSETEQGHVFARNRGIEEVTGDLLLWLDDDVIVGRRWLSEYVEAARSSNHLFWGGPIQPTFELPPPGWILENWNNVKGCFAERQLGEAPIEFDAEKLPYGANFAIRTDTQKQFRFNTELGRKGSFVLGDDELNIMRRILKNGGSGGWLPEATVEHRIPLERANEDYVYRYFVGQGHRIETDGTGWNWSRLRLWWHWKTRKLYYRCGRKLMKSPMWLGFLIRAALAQGQWEAKRPV